MKLSRPGAVRAVVVAWCAALVCVSGVVLVLSRSAGAQSSVGGGGEPSIEEVSYALGHDLGREIAAGLAQDGVEPNVDKLVEGFGDGLRARYPSMTASEIHSALVAFNTKVQQRKTKQRLESDPVFRALAQENARKSRLFMERFTEKPGAKSLDGGVEYLVIAEGEGATPGRDDTVVATFRALLTDGVEIASGTNVSIPVNSVAEGAQRALTSMRVGDHWYVAIPPDLAFGEIGRPPDIGPNEVIVADIHLIGIAPKAKAP